MRMSILYHPSLQSTSFEMSALQSDQEPSAKRRRVHAACVSQPTSRPSAKLIKSLLTVLPDQFERPPSASLLAIRPAPSRLSLTQARTAFLQTTSNEPSESLRTLPTPSLRPLTAQRHLLKATDTAILSQIHTDKRSIKPAFELDLGAAPGSGLSVMSKPRALHPYAFVCCSRSLIG